MDRVKLEGIIQKTITPRATINSILICLKSILKQDQSDAEIYTKRLCDMNVYLASQTIDALPENEKKR